MKISLTIPYVLELIKEYTPLLLLSSGFHGHVNMIASLEENPVRPGFFRNRATVVSGLTGNIGATLQACQQCLKTGIGIILGQEGFQAFQLGLIEVLHGALLGILQLNNDIGAV